MRNAPVDRARRFRMREAALSSAEHGEGFYLIGFDWQPLLAVFTLEQADSMLDHLSDQCFRAIVRVKKAPKGGFDTAIVEVGGEDRVYGLTINFDRKDLSRWAEPPEAHAVEVMYLRRS